MNGEAVTRPSLALAAHGRQAPVRRLDYYKLHVHKYKGHAAIPCHAMPCRPDLVATAAHNRKQAPLYVIAASHLLSKHALAQTERCAAQNSLLLAQPLKSGTILYVRTYVCEAGVQYEQTPKHLWATALPSSLG